MRCLSGEKWTEARRYMDEAANLALKSGCLRSKCGSIIIKDNRIIGRGFNSPSAELESQRRCLFPKDLLHKKLLIRLAVFMQSREL